MKQTTVTLYRLRIPFLNLRQDLELTDKVINTYILFQKWYGTSPARFNACCVITRFTF